MEALQLHKVRTDSWGLVEHYLKPVLPFFDEDGVTDICINRFDEIYVERFGRMEKVDVCFPDEQYVVTLVNQIANALGQVVDPYTHPVLDARLDDGSRVCAVLFPTAPKGTCLTIRVFPKVKLSAENLIEKESLTVEMLDYLKLAVLCRANIVVSGGTGSGKTTLLNILSSFIPETDRVLTVEDTRELQIPVANLVSLEAPQRREGNGNQHVDMAFLIKTVLRKNPTRILVGEVRDSGAAISFLHGINTGHSGTWTTIHANNSEDALVRLQTLVAGESSLPFDVVKAQVRSNLDIVIHAENTPQHGRRIVSIDEVKSGSVLPLWAWSYGDGFHGANDGVLRESKIMEKAKLWDLKK